MCIPSSPSKVLVLSPVSSTSILIIWFATLSVDSSPSSLNPNEKKSATIASLASVPNVIRSYLVDQLHQIRSQTNLGLVII